MDGIQWMVWIEGAAALLGVTSVWLMKKERISCYPVGSLSLIASVWLCHQNRLYAHMGANIYYFVVGVYGWYHWARRTKGQQPRIRYTHKWERWTGFGVFCVTFGLLYYVLLRTDSDVVLWDAMTTAMYAVGMWWAARKCVENWWMWSIGDLIAVPLYASKGLWFFAIQYVIFLIIAVAGLRSWKKKAALAAQEK